ncbi:hypothetical protein ElyMa_005770300 [Elysia marginata]|uniref:Uncharacterized protein n=1 Tax=Elysia marginata TaxID=1093978 RepID=A0AAV4FSB7_9GAST|nr:hypothetical protein ElyMa_005770300 [Elysia marginata]
MVSKTGIPGLPDLEHNVIALGDNGGTWGRLAEIITAYVQRLGHELPLIPCLEAQSPPGSVWGGGFHPVITWSKRPAQLAQRRPNGVHSKQLWRHPSHCLVCVLRSSPLSSWLPSWSVFLRGRIAWRLREQLTGTLETSRGTCMSTTHPH